MPIEPGDSWFSPKCMEVQPLRWTVRSVEPAREVRRWMGAGPCAVTKFNQTQNARVRSSSE